MRIISGKARGTKLETLEGLDTRPTLDRVKEALFSIIQGYMYEADVLDLFSGSGALAIESISRGAKKAIACDKSKKAIEIIKQNVKKTHFENDIKVINAEYKKALEGINEKFDIIFLDPPYKTNYGVEATKIIMEKDLLKEEGIIVFETDLEEKEFMKDLEKYASVKDLRKYGRVRLVFLSRKE